MNKSIYSTIGIDIGTGSIKTVELDEFGVVKNYVQKFYPKPLNNGKPEPEAICNLFIDCLKIILKKANGKIAGIAFSSCMHSLMLISKNNKPLTPLLTWEDNRSEGIANKLRKSALGKKIYLESGTPIHAMAPITKIMWFRDNEPKLFRKVYKFISIKEYIWFRLFNEYQVDISTASATGLMKTENLKWNSLSLKTAGIEKEHLSKIVSSDYWRADVSSGPELSFLKGIPVCIGSTDGCLANVGSFVFKESQIAFTIGTSAAVRYTHTKPYYDFKNMIFNYVLEKDLFISGGPVNNGGNVIHWLFKIFLNKEDPLKRDYQKFFDQIKSINAGSDGLLFLPLLNGERAPFWDEKASGTFIGIKSEHTTSHFLRAGVEGVCFALNSILEVLQKGQKKFLDIHISGGVIKNEDWIQMLCDITGKKLLIYYTEDSSAIGAALLGMKTFKIIDEYKNILKKPIKTFRPNIKMHKIYKKYFVEYKKVYPAIKIISDGLHGIISEIKR